MDIKSQEEVKEVTKRLEGVKSRIFNTGAKRDDNTKKPFVHMIRGYVRQRIGYHLNLGARKYGNNNFLKGIPTEAYLESMDRHLASFMEGDRSEDHLSAIFFGIQGCMLNEQSEGISSDYYFKKQEEKNDSRAEESLQLVEGEAGLS